MGKGDKKTRRGKITQGSYGKTRPKKTTKPAAAIVKPVKEKAEKTEKAEAKPKATKTKPEKPEVVAEDKPKTTRKKKTEE